VEQDHGLRRRSWLRAAGVTRLLPGLCVVAVIASVPLLQDLEPPILTFAMAAIIAVFVAAFFVLRARTGADVVDRRIGRARAAWARSRGWAYEASAQWDDAEAGLVVSRSWHVVGVRHRTTTEHGRVETWELKGMVASRLGRSRREVVSVAAPTGAGRFGMVTAVGVDPTGLRPAWMDEAEPVRLRGSRHGVSQWAGPGPEPDWVPQVVEVVAGHADLPLLVCVGGDRVVIAAMDDPRPETAVRRLALAVSVASVVAGTAPATGTTSV